MPDPAGTIDTEEHEQLARDAFSGPGKQSCSMPLGSRQHAVSSHEHQGLAFHVDNSSAAQADALQTLTAIAQVNVLCRLSGNMQWVYCTFILTVQQRLCIMRD